MSEGWKCDCEGRKWFGMDAGERKRWKSLGDGGRAMLELGKDGSVTRRDGSDWVRILE